MGSTCVDLKFKTNGGTIILGKILEGLQRHQITNITALTVFMG